MKKNHSLRYFIVEIVSAVLIILCACVMCYNYYIMHLMERRVTDSVKATIGIYNRQIESNLDNIQTFLLSQSLMEEEKRKLVNPKRDLDRYLAELSIKSDFMKQIGKYKMLDGIFLYDRKNDIYLSGVQNGVSTQQNTDIYKNIDDTLAKFEREGQGSWFTVQILNDTCLIKVLENQQIYVAGWVKIENILKELKVGLGADSDFIFLCREDGKVLDLHYTERQIKLTGQEEVVLHKNRYQNIQVDIENHGLSIAVLKKKGGFLDELRVAGINVAVTLTSVSILSALVLFLLNRFFLKPLNRLVQAMQQLKNGNLKVKLANDKEFEEFQIVNKTFDLMTEEIESLKIHVYEEQIHKQKAQLQYLQVQIDPHFLTNCMSLIQNLLLLDRKDLAREATVVLSKYMRYTLRSDTKVSVLHELEHVQNYICLQKLRYEDQLSLVLRKKGEVDGEMIPNMLIQTFVDNSVKHQLSPESQLLITVQVKYILEEGEKEYLYISVADNGDGFENDILEKLKNNEVILKQNGEHIGIYNVCQRMALIYGEEAHIQFGNGDAGGAVIEIRLPKSAV